MSRSSTRTARVRARRRFTLPLVAAAAVGLAGVAACGDDPFAIQWSISPDTVLLYSLDRPEIGLPSGFNFYNRARIRIEQVNATGSWDIAVGRTDGAIVLLPPGALGVEGKARIASLTGVTFDEVIEAPADTTIYTAVEPVPVQQGTVYVIRTNQNVGAFGRRCVYYAKLAPLEIDAAEGTLSFVFDASPVCNDRKLIPED